MPYTRGIQRVSILYRPENLSLAVREFTAVLGIDDFDGPHALRALGIRSAISWNHGIELIAPLESGARSDELWRTLREKGEGLYSFSYHVDDMQSAEIRARMYGRPRGGDCIDMREFHRGWRERFSTNVALPMALFSGVQVRLVHLEEAAPEVPARCDDTVLIHASMHSERGTGKAAGYLQHRR